MLISIIVALVSFPLEILYWIKWILAYIAIRTYNATHKSRFDLYSFGAVGDPEKLGYLVPQLEIDLESPQSEAHLQESADEIAFYGVNSKSECLLVRITRGSNQAAEAWIYLKLADGKTYHLSEHVNYQQPFEGKCLTFTSGNLEMHYLCPMRRWRIQFSGSLKEKSENEEEPERIVFVKFVFLWTASSNVYDLTLDNHPNAFVDSVARSQWENSFSPPISKIAEAMNFYCQTGTLRGTFSIDDGTETEINLFGEKTRSLGKMAMISGCHFTALMGYVPQNGFAVHLLMMSTPKMFKNLSVGFIVTPSGDINVLNELDFTLEPFSAASVNRDFQASLTAGESYNLSGTLSQEPEVLYSGEGWSGFIELSFTKFTVKNKTGYGLIMSGEVYDEQKKVTSPPPLRILFPKTVPLTVKFSDEISNFGDISGGKGSSLGKLTKLSRSDKTFTVPKGIIVTTAAYEVFLTNEIKKAVKNLENVLYGNTPGDVKEWCDIVSRNIANTTLPDKICKSIITDLNSIFGNTFRNMKFAVRSSATGEDTDVMSAAGQMDTFLGVKGLQDIFMAVKKCWASQFGHIAVEYKRQNGQIINSPMAVVIQEMVACDVSGVLFTCDPVTNNPNIITITANYGLGETVVSGSVEPDTIMLERTSNEQLQIKSVNIGTKHQRIVMQDSGGVVTEDLSENSKVDTCITSETAESLGKLAINVEKYYRSSRDIEWGIKDGKIYLLQSRPVTSGGTITEFELKHEFDTALRSERDYFTVANVGEVMPDATSPLGLDVLAKYFNTALAVNAFKEGHEETFAKSVYFSSGLPTFYCKEFISVPEITCRHGHGTTFSKGLQISIFGRILNNPEIDEVAKEKLPCIGQTTVWGDYEFLKELFTHYWNIGSVKKKIENYDLHFTKCKTAEETFYAIMRSCSDLDEAATQHMKCSESSSHWNVILFLILMRAKGRFDTDVYSDFGRILATSSNLESADIPSSLQNVANQIVKDLGADKFKSMTLEEAEKWLTTTDTNAGQCFRQFTKRHGHRCLKEFDVYSIPWGQDQKLLIKLLQSLAGCSHEGASKEEDSYSKLFSELRVPLDYFHRLMLRIVIPNCKKAVGSREACKSVLIKSMDHMRKGYQHLAKLMVAEGRIPDANLLYFMRIDEIRELLKSRHPKIISRANQRRKIFPTLDKYKFPEIIRGFPKPINDEDDSSNDFKYVADLTMQGIPVSQGVAKGYARVAVTLEEAELIKPGEILIAYSTDIGWSPYFPIISGVVTELGGLISHGAVVSREYGLPCVVGLQGATKKFRTGDYVLLDGKRGILQRLPQPQEE